MALDYRPRECMYNLFTGDACDKFSVELDGSTFPDLATFFLALCDVSSVVFDKNVSQSALYS